MLLRCYLVLSLSLFVINLLTIAVWFVLSSEIEMQQHDFTEQVLAQVADQQHKLIMEVSNREIAFVASIVYALAHR